MQSPSGSPLPLRWCQSPRHALPGPATQRALYPYTGLVSPFPPLYQGFFPSALLTWGPHNSLLRGHPVHDGTFSPCLLDASSTSSQMCQSKSSPDTATRGEDDQMSPGENRRSDLCPGKALLFSFLGTDFLLLLIILLRFNSAASPPRSLSGSPRLV